MLFTRPVVPSARRLARPTVTDWSGPDNDVDFQAARAWAPRLAWQHRDMPGRRRTDPAVGRGALTTWRGDPEAADRATIATAVRFSLEELASRAPGHTLEVRVPPFGVTQCLPGPRHTRGTPPNVIETDPATWLALVVGATTWAEEIARGSVLASGERADLGDHLPLYP